MANEQTTGQALKALSTIDPDTLTELSASISQTELDYLDGVTAGTVTASKAAVVDANKDIGDFRNLDVTNLDAGASGTAGSVDIFPTTASKGKLILSAADNTGDTSVTITNAAHGQATVVTIPDGGAATTYVAQSTAALSLAEVDVLDGAVVGNSVASKAALLDSSKRLQTNANVGTAGTNVTAVEQGDGSTHTTTLTLSSVAITIGDAAALSTGALIYTLPAGAIVVDYAYLSVALSADDAANQADTPEIGVGTTLGSAVQATLGADNAACENIVEGAAVADSNGTAKVILDMPSGSSSVPLLIPAANDHTVYLNYAATWSNGTVQTATASGTVVLKWTFLA